MSTCHALTPRAWSCQTSCQTSCQGRPRSCRAPELTFVGLPDAERRCGPHARWATSPTSCSGRCRPRWAGWPSTPRTSRICGSSSTRWAMPRFVEQETARSAHLDDDREEADCWPAAAKGRSGAGAGRRRSTPAASPPRSVPSAHRPPPRLPRPCCTRGAHPSRLRGAAIRSHGRPERGVTAVAGRSLFGDTPMHHLIQLARQTMWHCCGRAVAGPRRTRTISRL